MFSHAERWRRLSSLVIMMILLDSSRIITSKLSRPRVRTGYGILEKLWNFEKEIPYMEKLWNLCKTAVPMEKLWNFHFAGKKCVLSLRPDFEM